MKAKLKISLVIVVIIISSLSITKQVSAQQDYISFQVFYDQLSPYGQWVDYPEYGNVWIPDAGPDFAPYSTNGYWIMTEYGWTWLSDYRWGWAPFHYGRWSFDNYYGWFWVPDYEWGPAWVNWRGSEGYYGWSPMEPGISISLSFGTGYNNHNDHWNFVSERNFGRSHINKYYVSRNDHDRIIRNSSVINNTYIDNSRHATYISGPSREEVQRVSGRRVRPVAIQESNVPEQKVANGNLHIYRPQVTKDYDAEHKFVPSGTVNRRDAEPSSNKASQSRAIEKQPDAASPQRNNSNFNNTYRNNNSIRSINSIKTENNNNFNNNKSRKSNGESVPRQKQETAKSKRAESDKQPPASRQPDNSNSRRDRKSRSDQNQK
jgi:hypothetical protein